MHSLLLKMFPMFPLAIGCKWTALTPRAVLFPGWWYRDLKAYLQLTVVSLLHCVALEKMFDLSEPQFSILENGAFLFLYCLSAASSASTTCEILFLYDGDDDVIFFFFLCSITGSRLLAGVLLHAAFKAVESCTHVSSVTCLLLMLPFVSLFIHYSFF